MPSPFLGMDPWLESRAIFPDLHNSFIAYLREALNAVLPPPYFAAIASRVVIEGDDPDRPVESDVNVLRPPTPNGSSGPAGGGGVAAAAEVKPVIVHVPRDELVEWLIEVRTETGGERLVTAIEVLSRSNKRAGGLGRDEYRQKQREMRERRVNLVEIDLFRGGTHTTAVPPGPAAERAGAFDYHVCVSRAGKPEDFEVYPIRLSQQLPTVAIPLAPGTPDVPIPIQPVLDRCYDVGLYARRVKYTEPPEPPLTDEQRQWAEGILLEKGLLP
jgi:hypothetical protein